MSDGNPYTNQIEEVEIQKLLEKLEQIDPPDISTEDLDPVVARANALGAAGWQIVHGSGLNPGTKGGLHYRREILAKRECIPYDLIDEPFSYRRVGITTLIAVMALLFELLYFMIS